MRRAHHNLGFSHLTSFDMGKLVPLACLEVLPGDSFRHRSAALLRVAPLVNPVMHPVSVRIHHWYVPNRLLWPDFDEWIVGDDTKVKPTITIGNNPGYLPDYFGIEPAANLIVDALPFRAYNKIYNEFYRDQDLHTERAEDTATVASISWEKDYFTVARPVPPAGDAVQIPISGFSGMRVINQIRGSVAETGNTYEKVSPPPGSGWAAYTPVGSMRRLYNDVGSGSSMFVDLSSSTGGIDIQAFRQAIALQRFAEARARFGDRYVDYLRYLGVNPSDGRLGRPEYLGGGSQTISFSEVLATAEGTNTDLGSMAGHGIAAVRSRTYRKFFEEHGWVLTLISVRPKSMYQNGCPRRFRRFDPMDVWQRELEILPWQDIRQPEVFSAGDPNVTFGWTSRYDDYRHNFSYVSNTFRKGTEEDWHYARKFATAPVLNGSFITCDPTDRVYADTTMPELVCSSSHDIQARRLVSPVARI